MLEYPTLKAVHVTCVSVSFALFFVRGVWMMRESALLRQAWVRVVPHLVDTTLLASAIAMVVMTRQYPLVTAWLTAKVAALVLYIVLGMVALKFGKTPRIRIAAWIAAQAVFFYMVAVALARDPLPWSVLALS